MLIDFGDPRSEHWELMKRETMPPQAMLARRMEALTLGVLGQLNATANWHRIAREWLFGDAPSTELGAAEQRIPRAGGRLTMPRPRGVEHLRAEPTASSTCEGDVWPPDRALRRPRGGARARAAGAPGDAYGALVRAIVGQQLSTKAARSIFERLRSTSAAAPPPRASCSPPTRRRCARQRASRARRWPTCATSPSTSRTASCASTTSRSCPTRR